MEEVRMNQQDVLQPDEIPDGDYRPNDQRQLQGLEQTLSEIIEENNVNDEECEAQMAAAQRELADAEERRIRQHKELAQLRQELTKVMLENKLEEQWNQTMEERIYEVTSQVQLLDEQCDYLSNAQSKYVDRRADLCNFAQCVSKIVEAAKHDLDSFKAKSKQEIEELESLLKEEQALTTALLSGEIDDIDELKKLHQEREELDKEIRNLEIKTEVESARGKEIRERIALVKEELAKEEEVSRQNDEEDEEIKRLYQEIEEKQSLLAAEMKRKDEIERRATQRKGYLEVATAKFNTLSQKNCKLKKKLEIFLSKRTAVRKDLEQGVNELVLLKHKNATEIAALHTRKSELQELIRHKESKLSDLRKSREASDKRISCMEREISVLGIDRLEKQRKLEVAKTTLTQLEDQNRSLVESVEKLKSDIEDKECMNARDELCYRDKLDMEAVEIEHMSFLLKEKDELIARRQLEKDILEQEWEALADKVKSVRKAFTSRAGKHSSASSLDAMVQLEEMKGALQKELQTVLEAYSKAGDKNEAVKSQLEELRAFQEKAETELKARDLEKEAMESGIQSIELSLRENQERIKDAKHQLEQNEKRISSLIEEKKKLYEELENVPTTSDVDNRISKLTEEIEDIDGKIKAKRQSIDALVIVNKDVTYRLDEGQVSGTEALEAALERDIDELDKLAARKKEEITYVRDKLDQWGKLIEGNEKAVAGKEMRVQELKISTAAMQKEIEDLKHREERAKKDAREKEKERKAELEVILKENEATKKRAAGRTQSFRKQEKALKEEIRTAQKKYKKLVAERAASPEVTKTPNNGWLSFGFGANSGEKPQSLGVLTQRNPHENRELSPSSESISSIELSREDMRAVREGRTSVWKIAASQNKMKKPQQKENGSQK